MKNLILSALALISVQAATARETIVDNKEKEKNLIRSMAGCYKVTFEFAETFAPDKDYKYHDRKFDWGTEYVFVLEETENSISLQHLLIVSDSMIIKHWRQDWIYENRELLTYVKDNKWKKVYLTPEQAKGTWTQKVFQVDDGPRYEGYGTWISVDGRNYWESVADAPLPRREITKRHDYNVLKRHSRMEIFKDGGWALEQDNEKIIRSDAGEDKLLCREKGMEAFHPEAALDHCQAGINWWENNKAFWSDVRKCWDETLSRYESIEIRSKVNEERLYEALFALGDQYAAPQKYNAKKAVKDIQKILDAFVEGL